jgi:NADP-dependent alcohol dehydrogenase
MVMIMQRTSLLFKSIHLPFFWNQKQKLAQYGKRIFNLEGTEDEIAKEAINKTVEFFPHYGNGYQIIWLYKK